jgi:hypothetical protein
MIRSRTFSGGPPPPNRLIGQKRTILFVKNRKYQRSPTMLRHISLCLVVIALTAIATSSRLEAGGGGGTGRTIIRLVGTARAPLASGTAKFEQQSTRRKFSVEAEDLRAFNGARAAVAVDGRQVGTAPISLGKFDLNLDTRNSQSVPNVTQGSRVVVTVGGTTVLQSQ